MLIKNYKLFYFKKALFTNELFVLTLVLHLIDWFDAKELHPTGQD